MKEKKPTVPFPCQLKKFARTLHFHSSAAYEMVRRSFLKCLPCAETLNSWRCSDDYKAGVNEKIVNHVSTLAKESQKRGKKCIFNVTFDEMSIKKCSFYCKKTHEFKGMVDLGGQLNECDKDSNQLVARKALVFMLVNINGSFKTPVAYYLTSSLSGLEKSILLKDLLIKLHEKEIDVVSVTFDGDESNQKACKVLGANFDVSDEEKFKPYFNHPASSEKVFVFFDPCHMLKLVRNYFATERPLIYDSTNFIKWDYIKELNDKQYSEGMHCACKIKNRHVYFQNEKMKVFLAAQVLSNSTSAALQLLEKKWKCKKFEGASATSTFCKIFNDIFDLLNTKNKFCKTPGRNAVSKDTLSNLKTKIDESVDYIRKLEIEDKMKISNKRLTKSNSENTQKKVNEYKIVRKSVLKASCVRTGFVGFIICLKNLYALCEVLFEKKNRRLRIVIQNVSGSC